MIQRLKNSIIFQDTFRAGMYLKAFDGFLELIGGAILLTVSHETLTGWAYRLAAHELSQDPHDFIASHLLHSANVLSASSQHFGAIYLLAHGTLKLFLVAMVLQKRLWAYPWAILFLGLFIDYQVYRVSFDHSWWLAGLTVLDCIIVWLIWREYRLLKAGLDESYEERHEHD